MVKTRELSAQVRCEKVVKFNSDISASQLAKCYRISQKTVYNLAEKKKIMEI